MYESYLRSYGCEGICNEPIEGEPSIERGRKVNTNKPLLVAGLIAAISMGSIGVAEASTKNIHSVSTSTKAHNVASTTSPTPAVDPDAAVLAKLVTAGTITQAQSTAILAALQAAHAARPTIGGGNGAPGNGGPGRGGPGGFNLNEDITVVTSTLGITAAELQTDLAAGKSLATIAGTKTSALITALVAAETTEINARVTAGQLTQAQATTLISGLTTAVTAVVNATPGKGFGGHGGHGGPGMGIGAPLGGTTPAPSN